jgi:aspartate dehydrogenase
MAVTSDRQKTVAIAGFGAIGRAVAQHLAASDIGYVVSAVSAARPQVAQEHLGTLGIDAHVVPLHELADHADIIVECAPASTFRTTAEPALKSGRTLIVLSSGALLESWDLVDLAEESGGRIMIPSGAFMGLDAVQAAQQGEIHSVHLETRKPTAGLAGAPYLAAHNVNIDEVRTPTQIFEGSVRDAIKGFPANLNVAVTLSLAGLGPDRTTMEVWADPLLERNTHHVHVDSDSASLDFTIQNIPTDNPKTGRLTALSVIALLQKYNSHLQIGT